MMQISKHVNEETGEVDAYFLTFDSGKKIKLKLTPVEMEELDLKIADMITIIANSELDKET